MASSVSSERVFSGGGITINKLRNRLRADVVEALQMLKFALRNDNDYFREQSSLATEEALEDQQALEDEATKSLAVSQPIFYHELVDETEKGFAFRQRYWLRSYLGYQPVVNALPNTTHYALAALQHASVIPRLITQHVRCKHGHLVDRSVFQDMLSRANPRWKEFLDDVERTGKKLRTNPDGDVDAESLGAFYSDFTVPDCPACLSQNLRNSTHKPEVIFFGESISPHVKHRSYAPNPTPPSTSPLILPSFLDIERSDRVLVIGTTLSTFSAFRLLKHALELEKRVLVINVGPTRADGVRGVERMDVKSGEIMTDVVRALLGSRVREDVVIREILESGVVRPPLAD
ncbi:uncharacterized protein ARMOST_07412 [Armillaria ostoyae]|uniref:Deacetylase sirtuin-type domain-containing protein n=1 Tax=Armillaria ostoyae TaxID=47428 RepID=A0A284R5R2_ARMOS|nr:uncharacterized protein ARMOST_07412 [Armillaria ostoyae]